MNAPKCKTLQHIRKYENNNYIDETTDLYHWLFDPDKANPEVIDYLQAENNYTDRTMAATKPLQNIIFNEIKARIQESDSSAPWRHDQYLYYFKTEVDKEYDIFCRKSVSLTSTFSVPKEETLLDENLLAHNQAYFSVGDLEISPCHNYLAYTVDLIGNESYELYIKNLINNKTYHVKLVNNLNAEIIWSADSKNILYLNLDNALRPYQVYSFDFAKFNQDPNNIHTNLLFTELDERFRVSIERTRSNKYLLITSQSQISTEVYYLAANNINSSENTIESIKPRQQNIEYSVEHYYDYYKKQDTNTECFYVLINSEQKPNFELYKTNFNLNSDSISAKSAKQTWELLIPHSIGTTLESFECFADYAILFTKINGLNYLNIVDKYNFNQIKTINIAKILNQEVYELSPGHNEMYNNPEYTFEFESLASPPCTYGIKSSLACLDLDNIDLRLIKANRVLNNFNSNNYITKRIFISIDSNTKLPVSLVYNKNLYTPGHKQPLLLYGYGSYGISIETYFSYSRISLLDRGIAFAIAHIRGGGELGETWHHAGRLENKKNTFSDFITAAEYLINHKYTSTGNLIIHGGSAGGLLIGNVINQRPELFNTAIAEVPFVDCLNTMLNPELPLTVTEYEEWGNPTADIKFYEYIKSYAPYENIKTQSYPNLLINNSLNDTRVGYWEAAKWAAKLRTHKLDKNIVLLKTLMNAGHGGASGRYQEIHEVAFNYSFILLNLNRGA